VVAGLTVLLAALLLWGGIRKQTVELTNAVKAANTDEPSLSAVLHRAEEQVAQADRARQSAEVEAAEVRTALLSAEREIAALSEQLKAALGTAVDAREGARLRNENTRLMDELAKANAKEISLRAALQQAKYRAEARQQDLTLAATASSARAAASQMELEATHQKNANLVKAVSSAEEEAVRLREKLAVAEQESGSSQPLMHRAPLNIMEAGLGQQSVRKVDNTVPSSDGIMAPSGRSLVADKNDLAQRGHAEDDLAEPAIKVSPPDDERPSEVVSDTESQMQAAPKTQATATPDAKVSRNSPTVATATPKADAMSEVLEQVATYETAGVPRDTDVSGDTVNPNDLVYEPHKFQGRHVVVTGSMVWLFWRYRLKSEIGQNSIVIDVAGLRRAEQAKLEAAIEKVGFLGQVLVRIKGKVERQTVATFRLAASELVLVE
jgi:hypothetical protein